jgi:hypothetical protein
MNHFARSGTSDLLYKLLWWFCFETEDFLSKTSSLQSQFLGNSVLKKVLGFATGWLQKLRSLGYKDEHRGHHP